MKNSILLLSLLCTITLAAQKQEKFVVNPGQKISDVLSKNDIYQFPEFEKGTVELKGDTTPIDAILNYNLLTQTVQFISAQGDTLSLADEDRIKEISISGKKYIFNKGYYRVQQSFGTNKFLVRDRIRTGSVKKIGAYDQTVEGGASSYSNFSSGATNVNLISKEKITLVKEEGLFFCDVNKHIYSASKKTLVYLLPRNRTQIEDYISKNSIDFKNKEDIQKLLSYVASL